jgi:hypothetical protein
VSRNFLRVFLVSRGVLPEQDLTTTLKDAFGARWIGGVQFWYVCVRRRVCSGSGSCYYGSGIRISRLLLLLLLLMGEGQRFLCIGCDDISSLLRVASAVLISLVLCVAEIMTTLSNNFATA